MGSRVRSRIQVLPPTDRPVEIRSPMEALAVLEAHRLQRGLRQVDACKTAGYNARAYPDWARGLSNPNLATFIDFVAAFGLRLILAPPADRAKTNVPET